MSLTLGRKEGIPKVSLYQVYNICNTELLFKWEFLHLEKLFVCKSNYRPWDKKQMLTEVEKQQEKNNLICNNNKNSNINNENSFNYSNKNQASKAT